MLALAICSHSRTRPGPKILRPGNAVRDIVSTLPTKSDSKEILTRLPNGLLVYILKDTRFPPTCTRLYVRTGSANEDPKQGRHQPPSRAHGLQGARNTVPGAGWRRMSSRPWAAISMPRPFRPHMVYCGYAGKSTGARALAWSGHGLWRHARRGRAGKRKNVVISELSERGKIPSDAQAL